MTFRFGVTTVPPALTRDSLGLGIVGDKLRTRLQEGHTSSSRFRHVPGVAPLTLYMPFPMAWVFVFLAELCCSSTPAQRHNHDVTFIGRAVEPQFAINIFMIHVLGDAISPPLIGVISGYEAI